MGWVFQTRQFGVEVEVGVVVWTGLPIAPLEPTYKGILIMETRLDVYWRVVSGKDGGGADGLGPSHHQHDTTRVSCNCNSGTRHVKTLVIFYAAAAFYFSCLFVLSFSGAS